MRETDERLPSETVPFITIQIIACALVAGPLFFAAFAFLTTWGQPPGDPMLAYVAIGFTVVALVVSLVGPRLATKEKLETLAAGGAELSTSDLFGVWQTRVIVRAAVLEGATFFCCIGYLDTRLWWTLGMVLALLVLMLVLFPTHGRFNDWVRERRELGSLDRQSGF